MISRRAFLDRLVWDLWNGTRFGSQEGAGVHGRPRGRRRQRRPVQGAGRPGSCSSDTTQHDLPFLAL